MTTKFTRIVVIKFLPLTYHHSHFEATTLDFTSFFTLAFLGAAPFFLQLGCFGLDNTSFCICIHQSRLIAGFVVILTYSSCVFFFTTEKEERHTKQTFFDFISNYTKFKIITCHFFSTG